MGYDLRVKVWPPLLSALPFALVHVAHADTGELSSPFETWSSPPAEGSPSGLAQGAGSLSRSEFTVQTEVTVDWIYAVGEGGLWSGDGLRVEDPILHGMRWSKYGASVLEPEDCTPLNAKLREPSYGLVTASTSGSATLAIARSTVQANLHHYGYTDVWIEGGHLKPGDEIRLRFGDASEYEDCGHQVPDRALQDVPWRGFEHVAGSFVAIEPAPSVDTLPEPEVALLWVAAPSIVALGETVHLKVAALDRLGNPVPEAGLEVQVEEAYGGATAIFGDGHPGWEDLGLVLDEPGVHRVEISAGALTARSNPILLLKEPPERRLYWGDLHSHHGHTRALQDGTRVDENHVYARDVLGWDLGCESVKLPPVELDGEALWQDLQRACEADTTEGSYLALLGFEWMGKTRSHGHHNVYFDDCEGFLVSHQDIDGLGGDDGLLGLAAQAEAARGTQSVVVPHASSFTGYDWNVYDDEHRAVAEIYSGWGNSLEAGGSGSIEHALALGHRMGFVASSDNHDGWLGNPLTRLGEPAGIAAFWAPALTRTDIFESLATRQTYATTGARIIVDLWAEVGEVHVPAGETVILDEVRLAWELHGTDTIETVSLRGVVLGPHGPAQQFHEQQPHTLDDQGSYELSGWKGNAWAIWLRVEQADGQIAWSSPLWITSDCKNEDALDPAGVCDVDEPDGCGGCGGTTPLGMASLLGAVLLALRRRNLPGVAIPSRDALAGLPGGSAVGGLFMVGRVSPLQKGSMAILASGSQRNLRLTRFLAPFSKRLRPAFGLSARLLSGRGLRVEREEVLHDAMDRRWRHRKPSTSPASFWQWAFLKDGMP